MRPAKLDINNMNFLDDGFRSAHEPMNNDQNRSDNVLMNKMSKRNNLTSFNMTDL